MRYFDKAFEVSVHVVTAMPPQLQPAGSDNCWLGLALTGNTRFSTAH